MDMQKKGGRGKCSVCGKVVNNVSYHNSKYRKKAEKESLINKINLTKS